jgi:hypothetical protein
MVDPDSLQPVDWLIEAGECLDLARVAQRKGDRGESRDALARAGVLALVALAASVTTFAQAGAATDRAALARSWVEGYGTGRDDEAGGLPIDPRAAS